MKLPEYFEAFVRANYRPHQVDRVLDEFIQYASDSVGGSTYTHQTVRNLLASCEAGKAPESLDWYGC